MGGKLTRKPKGKAKASVEDFISGAEKSRSATYALESYPWEETRVRDDVLKIYNLRLSEPYLLKLKYISEHTPASMQKFCIDTLLPAIDSKIDELTGKK